jgi:opacity protein-like surface antigen
MTTMFAKQATLAAVLALAAAGSAFAADAQRNVFDNEAYAKLPAAESKLSREQVRAEFLAARANGDVNLFDSEFANHVVKPARGEAKTRLAQSSTTSAK